MVTATKEKPATEKSTTVKTEKSSKVAPQSNTGSTSAANTSAVNTQRATMAKKSSKPIPAKATRSRKKSKSDSTTCKGLLDNNPQLKTTLQQIEKEFGEGAIMPLGSHRQGRIAGISTGCLSLDMALGGQGIPRGRVCEMFGPESSGKTTLALHVVAQAQAAGGIAAFIDAEHALDPTWAKKLGVELETLLVSQPSHGEQALNIAEMLDPLQRGRRDRRSTRLRPWFRRRNSRARSAIRTSDCKLD